MLKINDVYADFQFVEHKANKINFRLPKEKINFDKLEYKVDYEIVQCDNKKENYFGVIKFLTYTIYLESRFLEIEIEGAFVGNKRAYDFTIFEQLLKNNGVVTMSQISRTIIMNITSNIGLDKVVTIPMINIIALNKQKSFQ